MLSTNWEVQIKQGEGIASDRRSDRRYDLKLELQALRHTS
jgi:hypothetical protein